MPEFTETLEAVRAEEASVQQLFGDAGTKVRDRRRTPKYQEALVRAATFMSEIYSGKRGMHYFKEAMSTSDFPILFADLLDRQLLGAYRETTPTWPNYIKRGTVPDFRDVKRLAVDGAESVLPEVDQLEEYPEAALSETYDTYSVRKYGRRLDLSWEALVNDDLDAFRRNPDRLARAARRSEARFATTLFVDSGGPHASVYTSGNGNIIPGNPALSIEGLQTAMTHLSSFVDVDGEPIVIDQVELVVPPALEVVALNILNATELRIGDTTQGVQQLGTTNWMRGRVRLNVEPYIPHVATGPEGSSSWFLFASPSSGRAFAEFGFLRGYEDPALYERAPNARRIGGGDVMESFEDDSHAWRIRHVFGGGHLLNTGGAKATTASDGSGS